MEAKIDNMKVRAGFGYLKARKGGSFSPPHDPVACEHSSSSERRFFHLHAFSHESNLLPQSPFRTKTVMLKSTLTLYIAHLRYAGRPIGQSFDERLGFKIRGLMQRS
jgi:hypothetical protein